MSNKNPISLYLIQPALALCLLSVLVSCVGAEKKMAQFACQQLDWFEIGRSDGVRGQDSMAYQNKKNGCQGFSDREHEQYVNGWYAGVDQFCTWDQGFAYGKTGKVYLNVCPKAKEEAFLSFYRKGLKVFLYEKDNLKITDELERVSQKATQSQGERAPSIVKHLTELETRLELNKASIAEIQNEVDQKQTR